MNGGQWRPFVFETQCSVFVLLRTDVGRVIYDISKYVVFIICTTMLAHWFTDHA